MQGVSLFLLPIDSSLRRFIYKTVNHWCFESFILCIILLSTVHLALENPLNDPNGRLTFTLKKIDLITTCLFAGEMLLKILAFGLLVNGKNSYLRNTTNILDFFVTTLSVIILS